MVEQANISVNSGPLGQTSEYVDTYTPSLLHAISRDALRQHGVTAGLADVLKGEDVWTGYEFSWLNGRGLPQVAVVRIRVTCQSPTLVESKSLKLYLGSFAQTKFATRAEVLSTLDKDLSLAFRAPAMVELLEPAQIADIVTQMPGRQLDQLDIHVSAYSRDPELLALEADTPADKLVNEAVYTDLFRSLCPVTGQPDIASLGIAYSGRPIDHESLLRYLVSYRSHAAFHEATIEQIFEDVMQFCEPQKLSVYGRFQRRGGLDINPYRSTQEEAAPLYRLARQ